MLNPHKLLCLFGVHLRGEAFRRDLKRVIDIEFPRARRIEVTDLRYIQKCAVCGKEKIILSVDSNLK